MHASNSVYFATSNDHKFEEARFVLADIGLSTHRLRAKGTETQSDDVVEIATHAAREAFAKYHRPLFVEDTGLFVNSLNGFPGPYSSYAFRTIGLSGTMRLLSRFEDRSAAFVSAVAYAERAGKPKAFVGRLNGKLVGPPRGSHGFGFDPIFIPEHSRFTLGEMSLESKCEVSHRAIALRALGTWLLSSRRR